MARIREIKLRATLNFSFASHAELTDLRIKVIAFCAAQNGEYDLVTREDPEDTDITYYGKLKMSFECATRAAANTVMTAVDNALENLPTLVEVNGDFLKYQMEERDLGEEPAE